MRLKSEKIGSAHLIAVLALFIALGSGAYAASKVGTKQIKNNAVTSSKIKKNAVTSAKIKKDAITSSKIKPNAVVPGKIATGAITPAKLGAGSVNAAKLADGSVTTPKVGDGAITVAKLADGSVTPAKMSEYSNSGVIKLDFGETHVFFDKGGITLVGRCADGGGGDSDAELVAINNGSQPGLFESDAEGNYTDPVFDPAEELNAFTPVSQAGAYWFGEYYNLFSVMSGDGSVSLYGQGNIGTNVLGSKCVFQLWTLGA